MIKTFSKEIIISSLIPFLYFVVICPISLLLRLINKQFIPLSFDKNKNTYWLKKSNIKKREAEEFYKQF